METRTTLRQRIAICFTAGTMGGLIVVLFSQVLYYTGIGPLMGAKTAASLSPPELYRPLIWGGLWGIPFGFLLRLYWDRLFTFGFFYFLAPVVALYLIFAPMRGIGFFGMQSGALFSLYLLIVNIPYGIVTAAAARWLIGPKI
jgi:hypothetical protein